MKLSVRCIRTAGAGLAAQLQNATRAKHAADTNHTSGRSRSVLALPKRFFSSIRILVHQPGVHAVERVQEAPQPTRGTGVRRGYFPAGARAKVNQGGASALPELLTGLALVFKCAPVCACCTRAFCTALKE
eukprot:349667-Chlamydomonas_euryale.AAC.2